jgi:hypothetical protein
MLEGLPPDKPASKRTPPQKLAHSEGAMHDVYGVWGEQREVRADQLLLVLEGSEAEKPEASGDALAAMKAESEMDVKGTSPMNCSTCCPLWRPLYRHEQIAKWRHFTSTAFMLSIVSGKL